jgi:hypothetical protein
MRIAMSKTTTKKDEEQISNMIQNGAWENNFHCSQVPILSIMTNTSFHILSSSSTLEGPWDCGHFL